MRKRILTKVAFTPEEQEAMYLYLTGQESSRDSAARIGVTHQTIINMSATFARQLIVSRDLRFTKPFLEKGPFKI